jgi:3-hydroxybutyrate dehydrogenase
MPFFFASDAMDKTAIEKLIDDAASHFGNLDIVVNNAGGATEFAPLAELSDAAWQQAVDWNLNSTFYSMRKTLSYMLAQKSGRIINISSLEGKNGKAGLSAYSAMKHAINGLTKSAAQEVGTEGITVNAICPGIVMTDVVKENGTHLAAAMGKTFEEMIDMFSAESAVKRPCTVEEVAAMAVLLASDASSGITGALLSVDGGTANY